MIFIIVFPLVYNLLKIRNPFFVPYIEPYISTEGVDLLPWSSSCCTSMFLWWPRTDKTNTSSSYSFFPFLAATTVECKMRADQRVTPSATSLLDDSKSKHTGPLTTITLWPLPNTFPPCSRETL